ncbi:MAG: hypothetical protein ACKOPN_01560, partial [Prochlorococcaceae cyanobacterium]
IRQWQARLRHEPGDRLLVALGLVRAMAGGAGPPLPLLLLIGAGGVALEQLGWFGLDNLTVPLAVGLLWDRFTP